VEVGLHDLDRRRRRGSWAACTRAPSGLF